MSLVEFQVGQMIASEQSHYAAIAGRIGRVGSRLDHIERRLDLVPG